jgi:hypothetical protein
MCKNLCSAHNNGPRHLRTHQRSLGTIWSLGSANAEAGRYQVVELVNGHIVELNKHVSHAEAGYYQTAELVKGHIVALNIHVVRPMPKLAVSRL